MRKKLLFLFLCCLVICSCSSTRTAQTVVLPEWFDASAIPENFQPFIGEAYAGSKEQSVVNAFDRMLEFISDYIGRSDIPALYRIELITLNEISDFELEVVETRTEQTQDKRWHTTIIASAPKSIIEAEMGEAAGRIMAVLPEVDRMMEEVSSLYRANYDTEAAELVIKAATMTYGLNIPEERKNTDKLIARATQMISDIYIEINNKNSVLPACSLTVKRARQMIHPTVKNCSIKVVGAAFDGFGNIYDSVEPVTSDDLGNVTYTPKNANLAATGTLRISVNLDKAVDELATVVGEEKVAGLRSAIESTTVMHSYFSRTVSVVPEYGETATSNAVAVCLFEYGGSGTDGGVPTDASSALSRELMKFGLRSDVVVLSDPSGGLEEMASAIRTEYGEKYGYAIAGEVVLSGVKKFDDGEYFAKVSGTAALFDLQTMEMLTVLDGLQGGSFGKDENTAAQLASQGLATSAAGLFVSRTLKENV